MLHRKSKYTFYAQLCFSKNLLVYEINVEKYGTAGQATDENTVRSIKDAIFMPIAKARIQTHTHNK
jgi:hypothetical protein